MGILDEAIRQHLDLKRRQGADDDELKRLEDEAFGPPTRPGEPDFPGQPSTGPGEEGADGAAEASAAEAAPPSEAAVAEVPEVTAPETAETSLEREPGPGPAFETDETPSGLEERTETQIPEPVEKTTEGEPAEPSEGAGEAEKSFFDQAGAESLELGEIDLDLEEGLDEVREIEEPDRPSEQGPSEPEPSPAEPPIESLDTVEHQVEEVIDEPPLTEERPPPADDESATEDAGTGEESASGDAGTDEDVLEETPEFLRDAPEDDELWFEQGEPKDFDFDD